MKTAKPMTKAEKQAAYDAWYLAEVQKGLDDIDAGRVIPDEEADRQIRKHLDNLHRKHAKKTA